MKLLWYNTTPLAGMPWRTARVIDKHMLSEGSWCRSLTLKDRYGDRVFPVDLVPGSDETKQCVEEADLAIVGSYINEVRGRPDLPIVRHYSTEHNRWRDKNPAAGSATVVAQYQARFAPQLDVLPNCIPIDDPMFRPEEKPDDRIVIVYTPTSRRHSGWASKGYDETMAALRYLASGAERHGRPKVEVFVLENRPYDEVMRAKRRAHIVIDECVTGSYHSSGLEGLSCGADVVCWIDSETEKALERLLEPEALKFGLPFNLCHISGIRKHLEMLVANKHLVRLRGEASRKWMEQWYTEAWQASTWINWHKNYLQRLAKKAERR